MITELLKYGRLLGIVVRYGRLRHSGYNFSRNRAESLNGLQDFIPAKKSKGPLVWSGKLKALLWVNSFTRSALTAAYHVKNSFWDLGRHLYEPIMNLAYIRIPKAGSTSLSHAMLLSKYNSLKNRQLSASEINFLTDVNLQTDIPNTDEPVIFFTVIRNPYARIVSVYRDFFQHAGEQFLYQDYLFGILAKDLSFRDFVRRLEAIPEDLMDQHVKPQYLFLKFYQKKKKNIIVLKLEQPELIDSFLSAYNQKISILNSSPEPYDYKSYYDDETFQRVSNLYKKDIERFHYKQEYKILKEFLTAKVEI